MAFPLASSLAWVWAGGLILVLLGVPRSWQPMTGQGSIWSAWAAQEIWWSTPLPGRLVRLQILIVVWLWTQWRTLRLVGERRAWTAAAGLIAAALLLALLSWSLLGTLARSPTAGMELIQIHP